jgi:hypothetical protein
MSQISEEQLKRVIEVKTRQQQIQLELGALYVSEKDIAARQEALVSELRTSGVDIQTIMNEIAEEHGQGTVNLENGEFTASEKEVQEPEEVK